MDVDDLAPLSGLQHLIYCERQAALIHVERIWLEDEATASGRLVHARADLPGVESREGARVVRSMLLVSRRLRLIGRADVVEFFKGPVGEEVVPVEYKRGGAKDRRADAIQVCAQAVCLEEMLGIRIQSGAVYYASRKRREEIELDAQLRQQVEAAAQRYHELLDQRLVPAPVPSKKCTRCSLQAECLPGAVPERERGSRYLRGLVNLRLERQGQ